MKEGAAGIFGNVPGTRTPKIISEAQYCALVELAEETHR